MSQFLHAQEQESEQIDSFQIKLEEIGAYQEKICSRPEVATSFYVQYKDGVKGYLRFKGDLPDLGDLQVFQVSEDNQLESVDGQLGRNHDQDFMDSRILTKNQLLTIHNLDLRSRYVVFAPDECGEMVVIASFITYPESRNSVFVSIEMLQDVNNKQFSNIYDALKSSPLPLEEKLHFIQHYVYDGKTLNLNGNNIGELRRVELDEVHCLRDPGYGWSTPIDADNDHMDDRIDNCPGVYNPGQEDSDGDGKGNACDETYNFTCNCKVLRTYPSTQKGWFVEQWNNNTGMPYDAGKNGYLIAELDPEEANVKHTWKREKLKKGYFTHNGYFKGAAKDMLNLAYGKRQKTEFSIYSVGMYDDASSNSSIEDRLFSPTEVLIGLSWKCTDRMTGENVDCGCDKDVYYKAFYNTKLRTHTELPSCFLCGSKGSAAYAEDLASLLLFDEEGNMKLIDVNSASALSKESISFNTDFIVNALKLAKSLLNPVYRILNSSSNATSTFSISAVEALLSDEILENFQVLLNTSVRRSNSGESIEHATTLMHNAGRITIKPNIVSYLYLSSHAYTEVGGYTSWNSYARISSDYLLTTAIRDGNYAGEGDCCSDGIGTWSFATFPDSPVDNYGHTSNIQAFYTGYFIDTYDNTQVGSTLINRYCPSSQLHPFVSNDTNGGVAEVSLYSLGGKKVGSKRNATSTWHLGNDIAPGMYFKVIEYIDGRRVTEKLFIHTLNDLR